MWFETYIEDTFKEQKENIFEKKNERKNSLDIHTRTPLTMFQAHRIAVKRSKGTRLFDSFIKVNEFIESLWIHF